MEYQSKNIFISHGWVDSDLYNDLVNIIDSSGNKWINLSVSESDALEIFNQGEKAFRQEIDLQNNRLIILEEQKYQIEKTKQITTAPHLQEINNIDKCYNEKINVDKKIVEDYNSKIVSFKKETLFFENKIIAIKNNIINLEKRSTSSHIKKLTEECANNITKTSLIEAGERRLEAEKEYYNSLITGSYYKSILKDLKKNKLIMKELLEKIEQFNMDVETLHGNISIVNEKIKKIEEEKIKAEEPHRKEIKNVQELYEHKILKLELEIKECRLRIEKLENGYNSADSYNIFIHERYIFNHGKADANTVAMNPTLALSLHNKIIQADLFIVIAQPFRQYKLWMDFEFKTAISLHKKIICIIPPDKDHVPPELQHFCEFSIQWKKQEIIDAIFCY